MYDQGNPRRVVYFAGPNGDFSLLTASDFPKDNVNLIGEESASSGGFKAGYIVLIIVGCLIILLVGLIVACLMKRKRENQNHVVSQDSTCHVSMETQNEMVYKA